MALLIALGANPNSKDSSGRTPYDVAATSVDIAASDKAEVLALLTPGRLTPEPGAAAQAHGCPHSMEDLQWFYQMYARSNPKEKPAVIALAVQQTLHQLGCPAP